MGALGFTYAPSHDQNRADDKPHRSGIDAPIAPRGKMGQDLFLALDRRDEAALEKLLSEGADPNSRNGLEFTPLFMAAVSHQDKAVDALINRGSDVHIQTIYGSALTFACMSASTEAAKKLIAKGADVNVTRDDGMTPLMMAALVGEPGTIGLLLQNKAKVNEPDEYGMTALAYAAHNGNTYAAQLLIKAGAKVSMTDKVGRTPLMEAAQGGHADTVQLLLANKANVSAKDTKGNTAILLAAKYAESPETIKALRSAGANTAVRDAFGKSPAEYSYAKGLMKNLPALGVSQTQMAKLAKTDRPIYQAVSSGVNVVGHSLKQFSETTRCLSCHHEGLGRMASAAAKSRGFKLMKDLEGIQNARVSGATTALQPLHEAALKDPQVMKQVPLVEIREVDTGYAWLMSGMQADHVQSCAGTSAMALVMAKQQDPEGCWSFSGPREPMQSSWHMFTALTVANLKAYAPASAKSETMERIAKAKEWLASAPCKNSEDRAGKLLGLYWTGASPAEIQEAGKAILADQRPDGGWSQLPGMASDAYATGQALWALHTAKCVTTNDKVYKAGIKYLVRTQDPDGSWFVAKRTMPNNNYFDGGFPHGKDQYSSFNGSCWALMALLETMPKKGS